MILHNRVFKIGGGGRVELPKLGINCIGRGLSYCETKNALVLSEDKGEKAIILPGQDLLIPNRLLAEAGLKDGDSVAYFSDEPLREILIRKHP